MVAREKHARLCADFVYARSCSPSRLGEHLGPISPTRYTASWPAARRLTSFNPRCFASVFLLLFSPCSTIAPLAACERGKNYQKI